MATPFRVKQVESYIADGMLITQEEGFQRNNKQLIAISNNGIG
ncbi:MULTISPECIES: hypothetical protein [Niastella]|nr:hypothetical protein [Niastella soli]